MQKRSFIVCCVLVSSYLGGMDNRVTDEEIAYAINILKAAIRQDILQSDGASLYAALTQDTNVRFDANIQGAGNDITIYCRVSQRERLTNILDLMQQYQCDENVQPERYNHVFREITRMSL